MCIRDRYRTQVLRQCGMVLPKHTFYVDNIFVYQPLPYVKSKMCIRDRICCSCTKRWKPGISSRSGAT